MVISSELGMTRINETIEDFRGKEVIFFDGVCNLCNGFIQYVIKHDKQNLFYFASLQSDHGSRLLKIMSAADGKTRDSIMLYRDGVVYTESTAVLKIMSSLKIMGGAASVLLFIPKFIRDAVYRLIARNRYRWFGKQEQCMMPTPSVLKKFI